VFAQHLVDTRLPALATLPIRFQDVHVDAQRLVDLAIFFGRAFPASPQFRACLFAKDLTNQFERRFNM
jgi:hypothetical protein